MKCPHCSESLTENQVFDLVNQLMALRKALCDHLDMEDHPGDPTLQICNDCGYTCETTRPI